MCPPECPLSADGQPDSGITPQQQSKQLTEQMLTKGAPLARSLQR
jgi:hypothetical protein